MMMDETHAPPDGFHRLLHQRLSGFTQNSLALYARADSDGLTMGFRVEPSHCNGGGTCHGGLIATFCDVVLALSPLYQLPQSRLFLPTISLSLTYIGAVRPGAWVQATGEVLRFTRRLVFTQTVVQGDGDVIARADGVYKLPEPTSDLFDTGAWLRSVVD